MKPPFKLPARVTHKNLIDWDDKVICVSLDTSEAERDYILWAVNNAHKMHKRLVKLEQVLKGIVLSELVLTHLRFMNSATTSSIRLFYLTYS